MEKQRDQFSYLPAYVIDEILSRMPIRDAVRTSILSTHWRYKWATIPNLVFDVKSLSQDHTLTDNKLIKIVDRVLFLHNGPIHQFRLSRCPKSYGDVHRWILFLSRRSIKEFILDSRRSKEEHKVPTSLFSCQSLIRLRLSRCLLKPPSTFKGFKILKSLELWGFTISQDVLENLISCCPMLERLTLSGFTGSLHLNIDAPNLLLVFISGNVDDVIFKNTFRLASVTIDRCNIVKQIEPSWSCSKLLKFFAHLPNIQRLHVGYYLLKYLAIGNVPNKLPNLCAHLDDLYITIVNNDLDESLVASCLLRSSPNLQELTIQFCTNANEEVVDFWNTNDHDNHVFTKLRLVTIIGYGISGSRYMLDFIKFLLSKSPVLETMTLKTSYYGCNDEELLAVEVCGYRRASIAARIICYG